MKKLGFSLIEVMVSVAITAIVTLAIAQINSQTIKFSQSNLKMIQAEFFLAEALEAAKDLELSNWNAIKNSSCTAGSPCHPYLPDGGGSWSLSSGSETISQMFIRSVWIEDVYRDQCTQPNNIVSSGVICPDPSNPSTKKFISNITWTDAMGAHTLEVETFLYNFI